MVHTDWQGRGGRGGHIVIQVLAFEKESGTLICTYSWDLQGGPLLRPRWSDLHAMIFLGYLADLTKTVGNTIGSSSDDHGLQVVTRWVAFASSYGGNIAPNPAEKGLSARIVP